MSNDDSRLKLLGSVLSLVSNGLYLRKEIAEEKTQKNQP